jgi:hypothetical protein
MTNKPGKLTVFHAGTDDSNAASWPPISGAVAGTTAFVDYGPVAKRTTAAGLNATLFSMAYALKNVSTGDVTVFAPTLVFHYPTVAPDDVRYACTELIKGFATTRDFLGYQLGHALGNISNESFDAVTDFYLSSRKPREAADATRIITTLKAVCDVPLDANMIADVLDADPVVVERAIAEDEKPAVGGASGYSLGKG